MNLLHEYLNGNYTVRLFDDGTKERIFDQTPNPRFPESMDVKITDYCNAGCKFCHENSTVKGLHSNFELATTLFNGIPSGTELALGGGNPLDYPELYTVLETWKEKGIVCNMTVNSVHVKENQYRLLDYVNNQFIRGLGISYFKPFLHDCISLTKNTNNVVFHVIMGVHTVDDLRFIISKVKNPKVLLLGYKQYGRGNGYYSSMVEKNMYDWYISIHEFFNVEGLTLSFDNLGIKQINFKRFMPEAEWNQFYMGDDGMFTFFIDLVKQQYTKSSTSVERYPILATDTIERMFQNIRIKG